MGFQRKLAAIPSDLVLPVFVFGGIFIGLNLYVIFMAFYGDEKPVVDTNYYTTESYSQKWFHHSPVLRTFSCHNPDSSIYLFEYEDVAEKSELQNADCLGLY
jgi:hypothetical protein